MADDAAFKVRRGTVLHLCIQRLQAADGELSTAELAALIGVDPKGLSSHLVRGVRGDVISCRLEGGKQMWRMRAGATRLLDAPERAGGITHDDERYVGQVSASAVSSVFAFAEQRGAAPFSVALHTDGRMLIERNGRAVLELTDGERDILVKVAAEGVRP